MTKRCTFCVIVFVLAATIFVTPSEAQSVPSLDKIQNQEELDRAGAALDAALFDSYNKCDLEKFASFFVDDVEFYHDQGGLTFGKRALTDSVKKNICGKTTRELSLWRLDGLDGGSRLTRIGEPTLSSGWFSLC